MARGRFLVRVALRYLTRQEKRCPYCHSRSVSLLGRKRYVLQLLRCSDCGLMFRYPLDGAGVMDRYYEDDYSEGIVTELPDRQALQRLLDSNFAGSPYDFSEKVRLLKRLKAAGRLLDYGCSWGYHGYQLRAAGFATVGFEVSATRRLYGRERLGLEIIGAPGELDALRDGSFDVIVANHVLEHVTSLRPVLTTFGRLVRDGGILLVFVPNCGGAVARAQGAAWGPMIGEKHPLALDRRFFEINLPAYGFEVRASSSPYDPERIARLLDEPSDPAADGDELMVLARATRSS